MGAGTSARRSITDVKMQLCVEPSEASDQSLREPKPFYGAISFSQRTQCFVRGQNAMSPVQLSHFRFVLSLYFVFVLIQCLDFDCLHLLTTLIELNDPISY
jgi:hypothetical protein